MILVLGEKIERSTLLESEVIQYGQHTDID